jgi:hypothetical protein
MEGRLSINQNFNSRDSFFVIIYACTMCETKFYGIIDQSLFYIDLTVLVEDQLSPTCTLLASAHKFSGHFLQTTIINGDKADSKILHLYLR